MVSSAQSLSSAVSQKESLHCLQVGQGPTSPRQGQQQQTLVLYYVTQAIRLVILLNSTCRLAYLFDMVNVF